MRYIFVLWVWVIAGAAQEELETDVDSGKIDHESSQQLEQQIGNLTARLQQLEEITNAIEDEIGSSRVTKLEQQVANLTRRLQMLEEKW